MKLSLKLMIAVTLGALDLSVGVGAKAISGFARLAGGCGMDARNLSYAGFDKGYQWCIILSGGTAGNKMNLFATVFRLLAQKKIPAYEYQLLDGTERFQKRC